MTPENRMLAASIGKTFVADTVLALESEGRLSRADLLADHLGDRTWSTKLPNAETITIGHLLRHQSGLPDHPHLPTFQTAAAARIAAGKRRFPPEELLDFVTGRAPLFAADAGWAYSDTGYILLGLVIEEVTGDGIVILSNSQRSCPLFAAILRDWSESLGVAPVGMARVLWAETAARISIVVLTTLTAVAFWIALRGRSRPRIVRIGAGVISAPLILWPLWASAQGYLIPFSILPSLWLWLGAASCLAGLGLAAFALGAERRQQAAAAR
ncbi:serine hydrolase domain-containing protein [Thioclava sp. 15-R06ZXC-3]|uniref:Serine hydrolase domain-containing protein n=1 Tax=Thioclava arctica TaxID=3238301 RepID=A0ABV3TKM4_9RHOB